MNIKNPIEVADRVMTDSPHCFFAGAGANRFAEKQGFKEITDGSLKSKYAVKALEMFKADLGVTNEIGHEDGETARGTVGAVALDLDGNLAAGTSTGGITGKLVGRVGDTPIIGAGVYADNATGEK